MAKRSPQTVGKREREQAKREKRERKLEKKAAAAEAKIAGSIEADDGDEPPPQASEPTVD